MMSSLEERLNRAVGELQLLDRVIAELQARVNTLRTLLLEYESAISFIEELGRSGGKMSLLVPIGAGNYIHAEIREAEKVEVSLGAGVVMTKTVEESIEIMKKRRENLVKVVEDYENQIIQYSQKALELRRTVEALAAKLREQQSGSQGP